MIIQYWLLIWATERTPPYMHKESLFCGALVDSARIIYTPSDFAKVSLLYLQEIGTLQAQQKHISKRENLNSLLFFTVISGSGELVYDGTSYILNSGDCVFLDCKKPYSHSTSDHLWNLSWIHFYGPTANTVYQKYRERGGLPVFQSNHIEDYHLNLKKLYTTASSNSYIRDMEINEQLSSLLTLLMQDSWHPEYTRHNSKKLTLNEIKEYLDENYTQKITLDELAQRYYINKYYLTRIFKEQFGVTINNYLLSLRITHAKRELRFSNKLISTIGQECGIGTGHYFSRVFQKAEEISPEMYRRQWK